jgi:hypothetical protein
MRAAAISLVLVGVIAGVFLYARRKEADAPVAGPQQTAPATGETASHARPEVGDLLGRVQRLSKEERLALGERIAAALTRARAAAASRGSSAGAGAVPGGDGYPELRLEDAGPTLIQALEQAIPHLGVCYPKDTSGKRPLAAAQMTLFTDPEVGTVIDTDAVTGMDGGVLDEKLETCLRDVIDSLSLPALGKPGRLKVQYTFRFE